MLTNYHSHTCFSDGSSEPAAYAEKALEQGLRAYGFSCHAPLPFQQTWCMKPENVSDYFSSISHLKSIYAGRIELYAGLEIDYIQGYSSIHSWKHLDRDIDFTIGSVHYVDFFSDGKPCNIDGRPNEFLNGFEKIWKNDACIAVTHYYQLVREMLQTAAPDIVGHIDKIRMHNRGNCLFDPQEKWYLNEVRQTLDLLKQSGSIMEINTRGIYKGGFDEPYPSAMIIKEAAKLKIPVIMNSDAHKPEEILSGFEETRQILYACGIRSQMVLLEGKWQEVSLYRN